MNLARPLIAAAALLALAACPRRVPEAAVPKSGPPRAFQLLQQTPEREYAQVEARRDDIEVETRELDRAPRVVASGETPLLRLQGARARLYGDAKGTQGWAVDNFVFFEVVDEQGKMLSRVNAGFIRGVQVGTEYIDNVGRMAFTFEPGEVDITSRLPEDKPFRIRATALDAGGVGRVSDLFVVLEYPQDRDGEDDLRGQ